jgi:YeeE/YedE family (DUF395).
MVRDIILSGSFTMKKLSDKTNVLIAGIILGFVAVILVVLGNPKNMGFCIACFIRDIAGALSFHQAGVVQYLRPEILGLVLGSFLIAVCTKEFNPRGGSSPVLRLILGAMVMIGALVFLGCPLRMVLRLSAGDLNALVALIGFKFGIFTGAMFLNRGVSLGRYQKQSNLEGVAFPFIQIALLVLLLAAPQLLKFSEKGPGSMHAPIVASFIFALLIGALCQKSRLCFVGGIRDVILIRDFTLVIGFIGVFAAALIGNLVTGNFHLSFAGQPVAHSDHLWNLLGMYVVGFASVLLGGCPLRQLILAGEGNTDSAISVVGMFIGAAISHNFGLAGAAASASSAGGVSLRGRVAVIMMIVFLFALSFIKVYIAKKGEEK